MVADPSDCVLIGTHFKAELLFSAQYKQNHPNVHNTKERERSLDVYFWCCSIISVDHDMGESMIMIVLRSDTTFS